MNNPGAAREYHRLTAHPADRLPSADRERLVHGFQPLDWLRKPPQFKTYHGLEIVPLPDDLADGPSGKLDVSGVARLLFLSAGVVRSLMVAGSPMWFRSAGSAGNLHPIEVYVVTGDIPGLDAGVYHYASVEHGLVRLASVPSDSATALVLTGVPWRTAWKYRERGFRHLWWDAGTMLAHVLTVAEKASLDPRVSLGFVDSEVAALVGAGPPDEVPLAVVHFGATGNDAAGDSPVLPAISGDRAPAGHLYDDVTEFPLITETHAAGAFGDAAELSAWREAVANLEVNQPPAISRFAGLDDVAYVIRRRGSTRSFDPGGRCDKETLTGALAWSSRSVPADFVPAKGSLLENLVGVFAVDDVEPGLYRYAGGDLKQIRAGDYRRELRHLCLDQGLGGNGSFTVFHCADLAKVTENLGARGYRAAQLEAGIVSGRLHLAAFARNLGATGLTFFDDETSRFFETPLSPMLVTAVGVPAYRARPGGLPRQPVRMIS